MKRSLLTFAIILSALAPVHARALAGFPEFPMAFWGAVTINGSAAPVGSVVRAYYGSSLAGTVTVQETGVYGYTDPTKQKLLVPEGTGAITFTIQSSGHNGGAETGGTTPPSYAGFTAGTTTEQTLAFTIPAPAPVTIPTPSGGGGGGGGIIASPPVIPVSATSTASTSSPTSTSSAPSLVQSLNGRVLGASTYNFTRLLRRGSSGQDVKELQKILIFSGFLKITTPTIYFGPQTETALKAYQRAHTLDAVGYTGPKTRALLNAGTVSSATSTSASTTDSRVLIEQLQVQIQTLLQRLKELTAKGATQ